MQDRTVAGHEDMTDAGLTDAGLKDAGLMDAGLDGCRTGGMQDR